MLRRAAPERRSAGRSRGIGATRARFRCHRARACLGSEVVEAKQALLSAAAGTSRGARASEQAAAAVLGAFERVEGLNACEAPADLPEMLDGWYSLLYQAPEDPSKASAATTTEGPFLGRLRPLLRALAKPTAQRQRIDSVGGRVDNVAEFELLLGALRGYLNLRGTCERASATRLNVEFTQADLALGSWRGSLSLSFVQPKGWVETTYLDADGLRLGRGDKGSIFVAKRGPPPRGIDD